MLGRIVKATGSVTYDTPESAVAASEAAQPAIVEDVGPGDVPADEGRSPTYVQVTDTDALAGKTLERVEWNLWYEPILVFTDGTFVAFKAVHREDDDPEVVIASKTDFDVRVRLGLVSLKDIVAHEESERHKQATRDAVNAAQERAEYERLKAKFEGAV